MSILLARVDDRLVHGQVTVGWRDHLGATLILAASDRLSANPVGAEICRLVAGGAVPVIVETVEMATRRILSGEFDAERMIVLFENLIDAQRALELGLPERELNLGGLRHREGCLHLSPSVFLTAADCENLLAIMARGVAIVVRMIPSEKPLALTGEMLNPRRSA